MNFERLFNIIDSLGNKNALNNFLKWAQDGLVTHGDGNPVFYHGSPNVEGLSSFSRRRLGENTGAPDAKHFLGFGSSSPLVANDYAETYARGAISPRNYTEKLGAPGFQPGVLPLVYTAHSPHVVDFGGAEYSERAMGKIAKDALGGGADALVVRNVVDSLAPGGLPGDIVAVKNPTQIKSIFNSGEFSPLDSNILKSAAPWLAGGGAAAGAMFGADEAQAAPHMPSSQAKNMERLQRAVPIPDIAAALEPRVSSPPAGSLSLSPALAEWAKTAEKAQALEEPAWSPADLLVAPVGAVGIPAKAAAMAMDAPVSLALSEVLDYLGGAAHTVSDWWRK